MILSFFVMLESFAKFFGARKLIFLNKKSDFRVIYSFFDLGKLLPELKDVFESFHFLKVRKFISRNISISFEISVSRNIKKPFIWKNLINLVLKVCYAAPYIILSKNVNILHFTVSKESFCVMCKSIDMFLEREKKEEATTKKLI